MTPLLIHRLQTCLRDFARDIRGSLTVEAVVMFPMLFWAMLSMLVFFDAYRQNSLNVKAAFTIGDMISREVDPINAAYLDGAVLLFDELARTATPPPMASHSLATRREPRPRGWNSTRARGSRI